MQAVLSYRATSARTCICSIPIVAGKCGEQLVFQRSFVRTISSDGPPTPTPRDVVVVRHGETEWNRELRVQGTTDIKLNARGQIQAEKCSEVLVRMYGRDTAGTRPERVFTSKLSRAIDTGSTVAKAFGNYTRSNQDASGTSISSHERLNEWNLGCIEGMRKDDAAEKYPDDWAIFSQWSSPFVIPRDTMLPIGGGGESMEDVRIRAVKAVEEACSGMVQQPADVPVILVTHGGVLGQLLRHICEQGNGTKHGILMNEYGNHPPANGSISRFKVVPGGRWEIVTWADITHLSGDSAPLPTNYNA